MNQEYLGDSYDLVKRFFCETLKPIAPLYADPKFVPFDIREKYTLVTTIPIYCDQPRHKFGMMLDPDTGVRPLGRETRRYASLQSSIVDLVTRLKPDYVVCYDQSFHRQMDKKKQMEKKMKFLADRQILSFYYDSHAPFLFTAQVEKILDAVFKRLTDAGVPEGRLWRF